MFGNSLIPTRAAHDHHHAHACILCGARFTRRWRRPAGQILSAGAWGDACHRCHTQFQEENEAAPSPLHPLILTTTAALA